VIHVVNSDVPLVLNHIDLSGALNYDEEKYNNAVRRFGPDLKKLKAKISNSKIPS
jgi:hypothetical protein